MGYLTSLKNSINVLAKILNDYCTDKKGMTISPLMSEVVMTVVKDIQRECENLEKNPEGVENAFSFGGVSRPKYRPFKNAEECWKEMQKHRPFGWIQDKDCNDFKLLTLSVDNDGVMIADYDDGAILQSYKTLLNYNFADGTPFGVGED